MARLSVEDCLERIDNRYDLVLLASKRTRQLLLGAEPLIEDQSDKPAVIALREIAAGEVTQQNIETIAKLRIEDEMDPFDEFQDGEYQEDEFRQDRFQKDESREDETKEDESREDESREEESPPARPAANAP